MKRPMWGLLLSLAAAPGMCFAQEPARSLPAAQANDEQPFVCPLVCPTPADSPASAACPSPVPCSTAAPTDPSPRIWGSVDYLLWWTRSANVPPLVVTGSAADPFPGALDQPGTRVLFGGGLNSGAFNGPRLDLGTWLDSEHRFGIDAGGFALEHRTIRFNAQGDANGQPFLAAPFVNALTGNDNVYFISQNFPNPNLAALLTGTVAVVSTSNLWSWEVSGVANLARTPTWTVDLLGGFRQTSLREGLTYTTSASNITPGGAALFELTPLAPGFNVVTFDSFATRNTFNGPQLGARFDRHFGRFTVDLIGKLAMGPMHETVNIQGQTTTNAPLPVTQAVGGIYAQQSNIGTFNRDVFAVIPEVGVNLSCQLGSHIIARVGYTFLYLSNVARPGDQIDTRLNVNRVPIDPAFGTPGGPNLPAFQMRTTGYWAQGLNFGIEFRF